MDPLVVADGVGEQVDPLLVDLQPVAVASCSPTPARSSSAVVKILGSAMFVILPSQGDF